MLRHNHLAINPFQSKLQMLSLLGMCRFMQQQLALSMSRARQLGRPRERVVLTLQIIVGNIFLLLLVLSVKTRTIMHVSLGSFFFPPSPSISLLLHHETRDGRRCTNLCKIATSHLGCSPSLSPPLFLTQFFFALPVMISPLPSSSLAIDTHTSQILARPNQTYRWRSCPTF